ncbi:MAG: YigZ family protein [Bacteroidales bacterium]|nr:YigZ family protein [Bacteroidales bacterium]MDY2917606.1 YigZ family protein [Muribaculaceae bacterium]
MSDIFKTITGPSEAKYTEKMSKFLAFAFPVKSAAEARERIAAVANKYHDARHVCWAYMIGPDRTESLSTDNGEPSGTAGKPILGQINSFGVTDIVIAVVRYFGGIKLGTSGLIAAYREAAREALEAAEIVECHVPESISFTFPYMSMNDVMKLVKQPGVTVLEQTFDNTCAMTVSVRRDNAAELRGRLTAIDGVTLH